MMFKWLIHFKGCHCSILDPPRCTRMSLVCPVSTSLCHSSILDSPRCAGMSLLLPRSTSTLLCKLHAITMNKFIFPYNHIFLLWCLNNRFISKDSILNPPRCAGMSFLLPRSTSTSLYKLHAITMNKVIFPYNHIFLLRCLNDGFILKDATALSVIHISVPGCHSSFQVSQDVTCPSWTYEDV